MTEAFQEAEEPQVETTEEEEFELVEPPGVARTSPYAIAAMSVSLLAAFWMSSAMTSIGFFADAGMREAIRGIGSIVGPITFASLAWWLSSQAEDEIFLEDSNLGGVGLYRAARILSMIVILILVAGVIVSVILRNPRVLQVP